MKFPTRAALWAWRFPEKIPAARSGLSPTLPNRISTAVIQFLEMSSPEWQSLTAPFAATSFVPSRLPNLSRALRNQTDAGNALYIGFLDAKYQNTRTANPLE